MLNTVKLGFETAFAGEFERNNTGGKKNLKCFPHCRLQGHRKQSWGAGIPFRFA